MKKGRSFDSKEGGLKQIDDMLITIYNTNYFLYLNRNV